MRVVKGAISIPNLSNVSYIYDLFQISSLLNTISTLNFEELSEAFVCLKDVVSDIQKTLEQKTEQRGTFLRSIWYELNKSA